MDGFFEDEKGQAVAFGSQDKKRVLGKNPWSVVSRDDLIRSGLHAIRLGVALCVRVRGRSGLWAVTKLGSEGKIRCRRIEAGPRGFSFCAYEKDDLFIHPTQITDSKRVKPDPVNAKEMVLKNARE